MTEKVARFGLQMRKTFDFSKYNAMQWFPGHMYKGLKQMQAKLSSVDCIIEIHDARIPVSGRNPLFKRDLIGIKPHILVMNKVDLIDSSMKESIRQFYKNTEQQHVLFTDCSKNAKTVGRIIPLVSNLIKNSDRYNRSLNQEYKVLIIGIPNVGKSSIINRLRNLHLGKGKATLVGKTPGVTRSVLQSIKVCESPLVYLFDTPGVLAPKVKNLETGLKLALTNTIKDHVVGVEIIADYLLFRLNQMGNHMYTQYFNLENPTDNCPVLLANIAISHGLYNKVRHKSAISNIRSVPNVPQAASMFLVAFQNGELGPIILDDLEAVTLQQEMRA